jgi:hypothetical protein
MSFEEAKRLILMDASDKSVDQLLKAPDKILNEVYNVTGGIPLAIRWLVGTKFYHKPKQLLKDSVLVICLDLVGKNGKRIFGRTA